MPSAGRARAPGCTCLLNHPAPARRLFASQRPCSPPHCLRSKERQKLEEAQAVNDAVAAQLAAAKAERDALLLQHTLLEKTLAVGGAAEANRRVQRVSAGVCSRDVRGRGWQEAWRWRRCTLPQQQQARRIALKRTCAPALLAPLASPPATHRCHPPLPAGSRAGARCHAGASDPSGRR